MWVCFTWDEIFSEGETDNDEDEEGDEGSEIEDDTEHIDEDDPYNLADYDNEEDDGRYPMVQPFA